MWPTRCSVLYILYTELSLNMQYSLHLQRKCKSLLIQSAIFILYESGERGTAYMLMQPRDHSKEEKDAHPGTKLWWLWYSIEMSWLSNGDIGCPWTGCHWPLNPCISESRLELTVGAQSTRLLGRCSIWEKSEKWPTINVKGTLKVFLWYKWPIQKSRFLSLTKKAAHKFHSSLRSKWQEGPIFTSGT